jgi:hypothetical protein
MLHLGRSCALDYFETTADVYDLTKGNYPYVALLDKSIQYWESKLPQRQRSENSNLHAFLNC